MVYCLILLLAPWVITPVMGSSSQREYYAEKSEENKRFERKNTENILCLANNLLPKKYFDTC